MRADRRAVADIGDRLLGRAVLARLDAQAEGDVLEHRHVAEQRVVLEHEADLALAHVAAGGVFAVEQHVAGVGVLQARHRFGGPALAPLLSSLVVVVAYLLFVALHATWAHCNFSPTIRWMEPFFIFPRFHHWHHGLEPEAKDVNFAVHLPMIDRWFGTHHMPEGRWPSGYGIAGERAPEGWAAQLVWPFRPR